MRYERRVIILSLTGLALVLGVSPGGASRVLAAERPVAVSPGDASRVALVESRCPTFSWGAAAGARSYELVVYRLREEGEEAQPVLRETLAGSASSWTPSLERCLERGGRYAWSVRAVGGKEASEWSALSLFQVASAPSEAEFEEAVEVVRSYLAVEREGAESVAAAQQSIASEEPDRPAADAAPGTRAAAAATQLSVDGNIDATSFTGDGENLANVATDAELATHAGEATVHHAPPTELPPSGAAGGDLTGTYPDPSVGPSAIGSAEIADGSVGTGDLAFDPATQGEFDAHTGNAVAHHAPPSTLPPTGAAGGDLAGTYPNPTVGLDAVGSAEITDGSVSEADLAFDPATQSEVGSLQTSIDALQDRFDCPGAAFSSGGRFVDCGNGTIRDMNTGKIWLKDASCAALPMTDTSGRATWTDAKAAAAALKDGICGLTDGSLPGQWRLPEIGEFCSRDAPTPIGGGCPAPDAVNSLVNTNFSDPALSNATGVAKWATDGDAFVGVQSTLYWSATELDANFAWLVNLNFGNVFGNDKVTNRYVWPVRSGQ